MCCSVKLRDDVTRWIFFRVLKNPNGSILSAVMVTQFLAALLWRKLKIKFLLASLKSLTNSENPFNNSLQEPCSGFQVATSVTLKVVPKSACDLDNYSKSGENWPMTSKESRNKNSDAAFRTIFRFSKTVFK